MTIIERTIEVNDLGYKEVSMAYRIARAAMLDAQHTPIKEGRIVCPALEASRSKSFYKEMILPDTDAHNLEKWAAAFDLSPGLTVLTKVLGYISGPFPQILPNFVSGRFNDQQVNDGFLHQLKNGIHTGMLTDGRFSQDKLNSFVWSFHSHLEGIPMTNAWLYSEQADTLYFDESSLPLALQHNKQHAKSSRVGLGAALSNGEMRGLLLGVLGQPVSLDDSDPTKKTNAILVRDIHDLYKYGLMPAHVEEKMLTAGLLHLPEVPITTQ
ncbi:MAG: hypothetical protein AAFR81_28440 [Chloroflexota bacterium]